MGSKCIAVVAALVFGGCCNARACVDRARGGLRPVARVVTAVFGLDAVELRGVGEV